MLSAVGVTLSYGTQTVLSDITLTIDAGTRGGLVGANGSGKTTLLKVLAELEHPDTGTITKGRSVTVEYLPQRSEVPLATTVLEFAEEGYAVDHALLAERDRAAAVLAGTPDDEAALTRMAEIDHHLESSGYYARSARIGRVLSGLGFTTDDFRRPLGDLSGGWRMRAALAKSLLVDPEILLLDEPTNYLDSEARLWLSAFLRDFSGGFLLVSHDRAFLDDTVTSVFELFNAGLRRFTGTYTTYEGQRRAELVQLYAAWEAQQREIKRQEDFIRRFRATAGKARQVQSRVKSLDRINLIELPEHLRPISISIPPALHSGSVVLDVDGVGKSYGSHRVLRDLRFTLRRGQRLAVVGLNGAGKSTLLRLLSGTDRPDEGSIRFGTGVSLAYFAQDSADTLPEGLSVIEYVFAAATDEARPQVRDILGSFLFSGDSVEKPLEVLSGGERSRVVMATLLVRPANLLILDEPTNHLDMTSQDVLAAALSQYDGTVIVVSHDRDFLRRVSTDVLALWPTDRDGEQIPRDHWQLYPGTFREFEGARLGSVFLNDENTLRAVPAVQESQSVGSIDYEEQKRRKGRIRVLEREEAAIMDDLEALERSHQILQEELSSPENYRDGTRVQVLQQRLTENEARRNQLHQRWEQIEAERLGLEKG
ncbi:MAG: ABC-F family ATP-binding cassette domain-containing protein [Alkalispirochaeta sp.]